MLTDKANRINELVEKIESITWLNEVDDSLLRVVSNLIMDSRCLHTALLRQYRSLNFIRHKGISKAEINNFKTSIDDLNDVANDLVSRFFSLPYTDGFRETTIELSLL